MRRSFFLLTAGVPIICFALLCQPAGAVQKTIPAFQSHLSNLQKYADNAGIQVVELPSGRPVWEYQADVPLVPASLVKILTSYAALKHLGPFHHFKTSVWALHSPGDGIVQGDIWIKSEGDFHLVGEKLWDLANQLQLQGIRVVRGGICIDNSFFEPATEQICIDGKCGSPYNPIISATAVDFNTINFVVLPGDGVGSPARVKWLPPGDYPHVINQATTAAKAGSTPLKFVSLGTNQAGREKFQLSGKIPIRPDRSYKYRFNIGDPVNFAGYSFRGAFEQAGIRFEKKIVKSSQAPPGAVKLLSYESAPLGDLLYGLNRYSNNFMAEMLLRSLGGLVVSPPGTVSKGIAVVHQTLRELGIPEREVVLDSGSGLSRVCRVSPRAFTRVLSSAYNDFSLAPELLSSLAVNAEEGTLRKRLRKSAVTVRGKTGTLKNVIGFAGYVSYPGKDVYAVTILLNSVKNLREAQKAVYDLVEEIPTMAP